MFGSIFENLLSGLCSIVVDCCDVFFLEYANPKTLTRNVTTKQNCACVFQSIRAVFCARDEAKTVRVVCCVLTRAGWTPWAFVQREAHNTIRRVFKQDGSTWGGS